MAEWAHVENNVVDELHDLLPENWKHVSGLRLSINDLSFLKELGWYRIAKNHTTYDPEAYKETGFDYTIREDDVLETNILYKYSDEELAQRFQDKKSSILNFVRDERSKRLTLSDWTQLPDVQATFDEATKTKWLVYRQQLRDLPTYYEIDENIREFNGINWPTVD